MTDLSNERFDWPEFFSALRASPILHKFLPMLKRPLQDQGDDSRRELPFDQRQLGNRERTPLRPVLHVEMRGRMFLEIDGDYDPKKPADLRHVLSLRLAYRAAFLTESYIRGWTDTSKYKHPVKSRRGILPRHLAPFVTRCFLRTRMKRQDAASTISAGYRLDDGGPVDERYVRRRK
jgi:hypothetical protein